MPDMNDQQVDQLLQAGLHAHHQSDFSTAEAHYRQVLALRPHHAQAWHLLGALALQLGLHAESLEPTQRALELAPSAPTWLNLAHALRELSQTQAALHASLQATQLRADWADAHHYVGVLWLDLGFPAEAVQAFQAALRHDQGSAMAHQGLLMALQYLPNITPEQLAFAHQAWGDRFRGQAARFTHARRQASPRRLGLVSGDFCTHPVGNQLRGVLPALRDLGFELQFYPTRNVPADDVVALQLQGLGTWSSLLGLDDGQAADRIHAAGTEVLIDLAGHTGHSRLGVFAQRPAPLQLSWLGYTATTGMECFDALLTDHASCLNDGPEWFSERLLPLDSPRLIMVPPLHEQPLPTSSARDRAPVFACFNNISKLQPPVLALWAKLLRRVPDASLYLKGRQLGHALARDSLVQRLKAAGIGVERLRLEGFASREGGYYGAYLDADVALDPFPFTGGATTLDALWMGVPVVTLAGNSLVSRQGVSILEALGHPEWIAQDEESYLRIACDLIRNPPDRQALRARLMRSPAGDASACAAALAQAIHQLWTDG